MKQKQLIEEFKTIVGEENVLTDQVKTKYYRSGFRSGSGTALAVVFPNTLLEQWKIIKQCVEANCIIIMQAAKTGLTEGSAPNGNDYDRDVVVINITKIKKIHLLDGGKQAVCLPGASLHSLEKELRAVNRAPHSIIGSSSLGATVVGGIANNSGGALVKRGPAYTELAIYAQVDKQGNLHLVNHLGIDGLGETPEEILHNLQEGNFDPSKIVHDDRMASDKEYDERVRDVTSDIPSRFNADERRLFEASGCAGKLGVFAVRVDSYPVPSKEQVFYLGTNDANKLTKLRKDFLTQFDNLPEMGEYLHRDIFNMAEKYGKDVFLSIDLLGTDKLPKMFALKAKVENFLERVPFVSKYLPDTILYYASKLFPQHLPERMLEFRDKYEHHLVLKMSDGGIEEAQKYLKEVWAVEDDCDFFECTPDEGKKAYLHRFAAAGAAIRYETIHRNEVEDIVALDIALRRNDEEWLETLPEEVSKNLVQSLYYGHFMCYVFHQDYIFKKGTDTKLMKKLMLEHLNSRGAKYPAEHNVGHLYEAENSLQKFYHELDPTNTFNPGIGKMDKYKRNCNCCA
ncbi:D-lactate dehydrogenase [Vibrio parahaemolyticus]|uniref:D-lactate dehydrogenase n=1 Tax=Vibrio parahaemolyticus TaxID=670 RepID=UPI000414FA8C|nr:D-lactate dehydrogenase [Vibrio parahaemolyticus]EGQ7651004.1 D-lactate dehydrogenase [Vibrio parahaemolyticus]EGQ7675362.1 D-lactate dehydrogenase [Vibrio parahaemolyticus]EGQ7792924.1 D-lactate dehydrogenase [Vibrio parahaemolyticus]EGQ7806219.1 D-lactate dehydrogenase [Vibrio parahaemolyticus]EGQ7919347.1 D-lactate dehydrogenase [Vibrio parahaemolyticus]